MKPHPDSATKDAIDRAGVVRPGDLREARDAVRDGSDEGSGLIFCGGRSKLEWGRAPTRLDLAIDTTGLDRMIEYDAGDMTATVGAGMTLETLQGKLASAGQWLAIDPPVRRPGSRCGSGDGATVGGIFATGDSGPRRLRYGTLRELVIGMTAILADGTVARSGSKVIKNVAGYDLCKLFCGSLGTLGLVAEITVRLHPVPAQSQTVCLAIDSEGATELALAVMASQLEPSAVGYAGGDLAIRFEGSRAQVTAGCERTLALAVGRRRHSSLLSGSDEETAWRAHSAGHDGKSGDTTVRIAALPGQTAALSRLVQRAAGHANIAVNLASEICLGLHTACLSGGDARAHAKFVTAVRAELTAGQAACGHAVIQRKIADLDQFVDPWGPTPPAFAIMRRVKEQLDPRGRCAPGRFVGGL